MDSHVQLHERTALVLYGSETGTAQELAGEVGRLAERLHFSTRVEEFDRVDLDDLLNYTIVIFAIATTGQGDLPANAQIFWKRMRSVRLKAGCLSSLRFASFGLGDSSYPKFNFAHRKLYNRLLQLGAHPFCDRGESDEQHPEGVDGLFLPWSVKLREKLLELCPLPREVQPIADDVFLTPKWKLEVDETRKSFNGTVIRQDDEDLPDDELIPVLGGIRSTLIRNDRLTPEDHWQDVRLLEFETPPVDYEPGDVCTIFPKNFPEDVNHFISIMDWGAVADQPLRFSPTSERNKYSFYPPPPITNDPTNAPITLRTLLTNYLDITSIPRRSFFAMIAHFTEDETQKERLLEFTQPDLVDELYDYTTRPRRSIIEVLQEFDTVKIPLRWATSVLPIIRGRQFSIASGGHLKATANGQGRVQLLVAIVRYRTVIKKIRQGVCTRYLAALRPGAELNVVLSKGGMKVAFDKPAIMIGPGTGVAPLRSMIYERRALTSELNHHNLVGMNELLFYGGRNKNADYFFAPEWMELQAEPKPMLQIIPAFSRDQPAKVYVQDRIRKHSSAVYKLIASGGVIYICGSSGKMPQAVREALIQVVQCEGQISYEDAEKFFVTLEKGGRYQQETW